MIYLFLENSVHVWMLNRTPFEWCCAEWFVHWIRFQWLSIQLWFGWMVVVLLTLADHKVNLLFKLSMGLKLFMGIAHTFHGITKAPIQSNKTIKLSNCCLSLIIMHCGYRLWSRNTLNKTNTAYTMNKCTFSYYWILNIH